MQNDTLSESNSAETGNIQMSNAFQLKRRLIGKTERKFPALRGLIRRSLENLGAGASSRLSFLLQSLPELVCLHPLYRLEFGINA